MRRELPGVMWATVVVMATLIAATQASIITMDIQNTYTNAEIVTECFSSTEHIPASDQDDRSPAWSSSSGSTPTHKTVYWKCIIATMLVIIDENNPPPQLWGWFYLYTRVPGFRPCYDPYCIWLVGPDGVSIIVQDHTGEKHLLYKWPSHPA